MNVDTWLWPSLLSPSVDFTQHFWFNGAGNAYTSLQQDLDGMRQASFSIWDATGAERSVIPGADCYAFDGGRTCTIPYDFSTDRWYRLRIWRLNITSYGTWWWGSVIDDAGNESHIGSILAPLGDDLITGTLSFSKYFGTSVGYPCGLLPPSTVYFYQPILNNGGSQATISSSDTQQCSAGRVTPLPLWNNTLSQLELGVTLVVVTGDEVPGFTLSGTVSDSRRNGPLIAGAVVELDNGKQESMTTGPDGRYRFLNVSGTVTVTATAEPSYLTDTVQIAMNADRTVDFALEHTGTPPFEGTVFITPSLVDSSDPTSLRSVTFAGRGTREFWDRPAERWITVNAYLFDVQFTGRELELGAALLRWRPNQSLRRRRGRRQLDPSRRGEERRRGRWPTVLLSSATDGGLPLVLARFVRGLSTHQGSGCLRRLRTAATAAKCHRAPVDSHRVADQMPTGPSTSRRRAPHAASPLPRG